MSSAVWEHIRAGRPPTPRRVDALAAAGPADADGYRLARADLHAQVLGAGPLDPLLADRRVTDVLVNGAGGVWVDRGAGLEPAHVAPLDDAQARRLAVRLAGLAERRLDDACPYVDGLLPGGIRLHALLPPLVEGGAHVSLRIPRHGAADLDRLGALGLAPPAWLAVLRALVAAKVSYVVSGGTGAGKSTLLAALLGLVPAHERIVLVEDVRELAVDHPHVVHLQGRPANVEGRGGVDLVVLVRQCLRMRPDRLALGEVRGPEVRDMLTALNTGHEGGCGTIHANTGGDVVARFEALGALAGMSPTATRAQLRTALSVVVHVRRVGAQRVVDGVWVLDADRGDLAARPALLRPREGWAALDPGGGGGGGADGPLGARPDGAPPGAVEPGWGMLAALLGLDAGPRRLGP
ncbi:TadA family conjugal transfer-associated ATPase [Agilicoccus flavus]|uniref:TadA family conjugal transfer-associated ATPase n=1 Tax=Agilicoccus flavus TaxID=2775968 RepID=UPI001CF61AC8|nr:TadA family conjugal transfer-associated ATPase [Agilicoccus flavus]